MSRTKQKLSTKKKQSWDKQRRDLLPRHVVVTVSSFVRVHLGDAFVLRAVANILEVSMCVCLFCVFVCVYICVSIYIRARASGRCLGVWWRIFLMFDCCYVFICVCVYVFVLCVYVNMHGGFPLLVLFCSVLGGYLSVCVCVCVCVSECVCVCVCVYVSVRVYLFVRAYMCM